MARSFDGMSGGAARAVVFMPPVRADFAMSVGHLLTCLRIETMCKFAFNSTFVGAILRAIDLEVDVGLYK